MLTLRIVLAALLLAVSGLAFAADSGANPGRYEPYYGNYRVAPDHFIGLSRYITDDGAEVVLYSDYKSGVVRRLFAVSDTEFTMGPGFQTPSPVELRARFVRDASGAVTGVSLEPAGSAARVAQRVPLKEEQVVIDANGKAKLAGTLMLPAGPGPHPAVVLLHGSGPLTRHSFGPYPHFFTSMGFAVLIFDKRGTGASTGTRLDASTGASAPLPDAYYPDDLVSDATAVFRFLQRRPEIDSRKIGLWGSSEGGMLTTQVAARNRDVAFAINSSGFVGPLWGTILYQAGASLKSRGYTDAQAEEAWEFARLWMRVARTGTDYDLFTKKRDEALKADKKWLLSYFSDEYTTLAQMRWDWDHILAFDARPALKKVSCPVLAVFGAKDPLTDASVAPNELRKALSEGGNEDVTIRVFPNAGHSLSEMPSGSRMAPGVFDTLRTWLHDHVRIGG